ncbi:hypothetical protein VTI74DRAFT_9538 [Chaetomium olivicolor]
MVYYLRWTCVTLALAASAQQTPPLNFTTQPFDVDVVFPRNETYRQTETLPIVLAVQNLTTWTVGNYNIYFQWDSMPFSGGTAPGGMLYDSGQFQIPWNRLAATPSFLIDAIDATNVTTWYKGRSGEKYMLQWRPSLARLASAGMQSNARFSGSNLQLLSNLSLELAGQRFLHVGRSVDARISQSTIRRVLRHYRMRKWRAQKRIPLTKEVAMARYKFACFWLENIEILIRSIFTDESTCQNNSSGPTTWVFRFPSQKWDKNFVNLHSYGKGNISIMIWAGIWKGGRADLIVMERDYQPP